MMGRGVICAGFILLALSTLGVCVAVTMLDRTALAMNFLIFTMGWLTVFGGLQICRSRK